MRPGRRRSAMAFEVSYEPVAAFELVRYAMQIIRSRGRREAGSIVEG
jgi:hypothetical protein